MPAITGGTGPYAPGARRDSGTDGWGTILRVLLRWAIVTMLVFGMVGPAGTAHAALAEPRLTLSGPTELNVGEPGQVVVRLEAPQMSGVEVTLAKITWDNPGTHAPRRPSDLDRGRDARPSP
jgi:hypothetical protein